MLPPTTVASVPETCDIIFRIENYILLFKVSDTVPVMDIVEEGKWCMMALMTGILTSSYLIVLSHN